MPGTPKQTEPIGYISPHIPQFELPSYEGDRYQATVPDTLDVAERARLAINGLTGPTNPRADHEIYWIVDFRTNPPSMFMNCWQGPTLPKFMVAVSLLRLLSGSDQNLDVERQWMEVALRMQGPDGLIYTPVQGRPWAFVWWPLPDVEPPEEQILSPFGNGTMMTEMAHLAKRDPDGVWKKSLRWLVDGLIDLAVTDGQYAYYWPSCIVASNDRPSRPGVPLHAFESEGSVIPHGCVHAYKVLGYEPALILAKKYINYLRDHFYAADGRFLSTPGQPMNAHCHAHSRGLLAMEEYAEVAGDDELMEFVVRSFEWVRDIGANVERVAHSYDLVKTPGAALIGFFPEWTNSPAWQTSETCQVTDMVALAMRLSEAGVGDYWDDADRWIRNQFAENQLLETDWVYDLAKAGSPPETGAHFTADRVPERNLGAFAGCPSPNEWWARYPEWVPLGHCCTANGSKCLFWIWDHILRHRDGKLRVNLLLNRASEWADIDSYIPYQGRVEVQVKKPVDLSVRLPEWVTAGETRCQVNGKDRSCGWSGRYALIGDVKPGDVVTLTFPIFERMEEIWVEKRKYRLVRKGNDVVSIDPPGTVAPLYRREHYRSSEPRVREVTRFVSSEHVEW